MTVVDVFFLFEQLLAEERFGVRVEKMRGFDVALPGGQAVGHSGGPFSVWVESPSVKHPDRTSFWFKGPAESTYHWRAFRLNIIFKTF